MTEMIRVPVWILPFAVILLLAVVFEAYRSGDRHRYEHELDERRKLRQEKSDLRARNDELLTKIREWEDHCEYLEGVKAAVVAHAGFWKRIAVSLGWHKRPKKAIEG